MPAVRRHPHGGVDLAVALVVVHPLDDLEDDIMEMLCEELDTEPPVEVSIEMVSVDQDTDEVTVRGKRILTGEDDE